MRVITPPPRPASPPAGSRRSALIELLGLSAASLAVAIGILVTSFGKAQSFATVDADLESGRLVNLGALRSPGDLAPRLTMFTVAAERELVARAVYRRATAGSPLENIGGLADVGIPAADVRRDRRYVRLRTRLPVSRNASAAFLDRQSRTELVRALSAADMAALKPALIVRTPADFREQLWLAAAMFFASFWAAHLLRWIRRATDDALLVPIVMLLTGLGLMSMIALRDPLRDTFIAFRFASGVAAGVAALVATSLVDYEASRLRRAVVLPLGLALTLAVLLLVFGDGPGSSGAKVNLFGVQPVEAIRLLVVFALAAYFAPRLDFLREYSEPATADRPWLRYLDSPRLKDVAPVFVSMSLVLAFFFLQKDLGPALVLSFVFLGLYGLARGRLGFVIASLGALLAAFTAAYRLGFPSTVRQRVAMWLDPWSNALPGGDQLAHGFWAMSTGAFWGSGAGVSSPQLIPAAHTDFVLAAIGEELGWVGLVVVVSLYALLGWRCFLTALRAPGDYTALLCSGIGLALLLQAIVIASGLLALLPLSGVVTPFLSYGRSSMLANCAALGVVLAVSRRAGAVRPHLAAPVRILGSVLAIIAVVIVGRAGWIQVVNADAIASTASLTEQGDGGIRFEYNPRLLAVARTIERGSILDRNGLPLATGRPEERRDVARLYRTAQIGRFDPCDTGTGRCYPLGGMTFHLLGDTRQTNWAARNTSFLERDLDAALQGFDDRATSVEVRNPRTGASERALKRDYRELLPLLRDSDRPDSAAVKAILGRNRDVRSSIDARLQFRAAEALRKHIESNGFHRGAAVVLDVETGEVLASVSYPWPTAGDLTGGRPPRPSGRPGETDATVGERLFDRPRYGLYPPGSTFKLVIAAAALRGHAAISTEPHACIRLPDGRVGNFVGGSPRPIRDDPLDTAPHGAVDLRRGLVVSCNAYFAQLALRIGPRAVMETASLFQIDVARTPTEKELRRTLAHAGYGQGEVVVSPVKMARVAAAIARRGRIPVARWTIEAGTAAGADDARVLSEADATLLSHYMREVVTAGTGRVLATNLTPIAGKTGTAEIDRGPAHSWFVGYAPYGPEASRRLAFAVIVENAGYGARAAAPLAGDLVSAARELGLFR